MPGHQVAGHQRVLGEVQRKAEALEATQHFAQLLRAHVALVLVGLQADDPDGNTCVQAVADQACVLVREVEVVDQQQRLRVGGLRGGEYLLDQRHPAIALADAGDGVVVAVEHRHDDRLVDHVPDVDDPGKGDDFPVDARQLLVEDGLVVIGHQPVGAYRVPAQRVAFEPNPVIHQEPGGVHAVFEFGLALLRLVLAPVKGEGAVVEQAQPLFHAIPEEGVALFFIGTGEGVKGPAAEAEVVGLLGKMQARVCDGPALRVEDAQGGAGLAVVVGHKGSSFWSMS